MAREFAEVAYSLTNCIVAAYNLDANTYGTPAALDDGQMVTIEPESDNDQLRGYGVKKRLLSVVVGAKISIKAGGIDFSVMAALSGMSNATSGTTPNQRRTTRVPAGGAGMPYFGLIGVAVTDDGGTVPVGLQACKLDIFPKWELNGEQNKFIVSEMAGYAIPVGGYLETILTEETAANFVVPASGADFLAFFS